MQASELSIPIEDDTDEDETILTSTVINNEEAVAEANSR